MKTIFYLTCLITLLASSGCVSSRPEHKRTEKQSLDDQFNDYDQDKTKGRNSFHQRPDERDLETHP